MTESIYHLVLRPLWEATPEQDYRADSLADEGFIHCSKAHQVARSANKYYANAEGLLVLTIAPDKLTSPLKDEPAAGDVFPHVYGPLNRDAVVAVTELSRDASGRWAFPPPV